MIDPSSGFEPAAGRLLPGAIKFLSLILAATAAVGACSDDEGES